MAKGKEICMYCSELRYCLQGACSGCRNKLPLAVRFGEAARKIKRILEYNDEVSKTHKN